MTKRETLEAAIRGEGCLGKAADDEPVFVLRAQDVLSAGVLGYWLRRARGHGVNPAKLENAVVDLEAFQEWQRHEFTKLPD